MEYATKHNTKNTPEYFTYTNNCDTNTIICQKYKPKNSSILLIVWFVISTMVGIGYCTILDRIQLNQHYV